MSVEQDINEAKKLIDDIVTCVKNIMMVGDMKRGFWLTEISLYAERINEILDRLDRRRKKGEIHD